MSTIRRGNFSPRLLPFDRTIDCYHLISSRLSYLHPLLSIINLSLSSGIFPDKLKIAKITTIRKTADASLVKKYRPSLKELPIIVF